ncbi:hypothetical protein AB0J84_15500 [Micromonospora arborensis]|uniref:hypothetical protein n=1 Tax=Micromonospora arborensis TaxID=2116518 RepID=UPI003414F65E
MSIGEVKAALREANQLFDQGKATFEVIDTSLDEVTGLAVSTLYDSQQAEAENARGALADAARAVESTLRAINASTENAGTYLRELG